MVYLIHIILSALVVVIAASSFIGLSFDVLFDKDFSLLYIYLTLPFLVFFLVTDLYPSRLSSFTKIGLPIVLLMTIVEIIFAAYQEWGSFPGKGFNAMVVIWMVVFITILLVTNFYFKFSKKSNP